MKKPLKKTKKTKEVVVEVKIDERVHPIVDAIAAAAAVLNDETEKLLAGKSAELDGFLERKRDVDRQIKTTMKSVKDDGFELTPGTREAELVENALEALRTAAIANAEALQGAKNAIDHITALFKRASAEKGSEGMYNRKATMVASRDKTMLGFGAQI